MAIEMQHETHRQSWSAGLAQSLMAIAYISPSENNWSHLLGIDYRPTNAAAFKQWIYYQYDELIALKEAETDVIDYLYTQLHILSDKSNWG